MSAGGVVASSVIHVAIGGIARSFHADIRLRLPRLWVIADTSGVETAFQWLDRVIILFAKQTDDHITYDAEYIYQNMEQKQSRSCNGMQDD
jgi:hypothetical protein